MKKRFQFCLPAALILSLILTSCAATQKSVVEVSESYADFTTEQLIDEADLIVKGRVASMDEGMMTNPENDRNLKDDDGRGYANEQIHTYVFEIDTVYKGEYTADTIEIKTSNGYALSPDLILYGEDESSILSGELDRFDLEVGSECILTLKYMDLRLQARNGYYVLGEKQGVFTPNQEDLFTK